MNLSKICVLGTGWMGRQIAQHAAQCGYDVTFIGQRKDPQVTREGLDLMRGNLQKFYVDKGKMTAGEMEAVLGRINGCTDLAEAVNGAQVVIENIMEDLELKQNAFKELDELCSPDTVLASDSSGLMITGIGALTKRPDKVVGMHFFNPVAVMKLIEIVRGVKTSDETIETIKELSASFGKETITINDSPGYVVSRLFTVLVNESAKLVNEGVCSPEDVDKGCQMGLGHAMGPLRAWDIGNGMAHGPLAMAYMREMLGDEYRPCPLITKLNLAGEYGVATNKGFFSYPPKQ